MPVLLLVISKLFIAVVPLQILLRLFIFKTELKANGCQLFDLFLRKVRFIDMEICLDFSSLVGTPLSQRGAVMRATMRPIRTSSSLLWKILFRRAVILSFSSTRGTEMNIPKGTQNCGMRYTPRFDPISVILINVPKAITSL